MKKKKKHYQHNHPFITITKLYIFSNNYNKEQLRNKR